MARRISSGVWLVGAGLSLALGAMACPASTVLPPPETSEEGGEGGEGGDGGFSASGGGGSDACDCAPGDHNDVIYTLSDESEIWSYDPELNSMSYVTTLLCEGSTKPYSMAVDHRGVAWVLFASNNLVFNVNLVDGGPCTVSPYTPYQTGFDLFGLGFSGPEAACPDLYGLSYSASGPFAEGSDIGELVQIDPMDGTLTTLGAIDYDGGELAGNSDGQLFAFAGVNPSKLVTFDRGTGAATATTNLDGLAKTAASAFAFISGDFYIFTEAWPPGCAACLTTNCPTEFANCQADPTCSQHLQCAIDANGIEDDCGGMMPQAMIDCLAPTCESSCLMGATVRVSQVTRYDADDSDGGGMSVVLPDAGIRVVGAANSTCVPLTPK